MSNSCQPSYRHEQKYSRQVSTYWLHIATVRFETINPQISLHCARKPSYWLRPCTKQARHQTFAHTTYGKAGPSVRRKLPSAMRCREAPSSVRLFFHLHAPVFFPGRDALLNTKCLWTYLFLQWQAAHYSCPMWGGCLNKHVLHTEISVILLIG